MPMVANAIKPGDVVVLDVFVQDGDGLANANATAGGGNPVPLVAEAQGMSAAEMQAVAAAHGHESAFVLPPTPSHSRAGHARCDWRLRFFVPGHEMEMCGHATVGSLWALRQWGMWTTPTALIETLSGPVHVKWDGADDRVWISQPAASTRVLTADERAQVARVLGLPTDAAGYVMVNASTSRVKTLVSLPTVSMLDGLRPDFAAMQALCEAIGSTGLYPFAMGEQGVAHARQFPKASGYPEDAATGIAAAALFGYLAIMKAGDASTMRTLRVRQGEAMGRPSEIEVMSRFEGEGEGDGNDAEAAVRVLAGCWLSGRVRWAQP